MTTIAYRGGIMACDSCWTLSETVDVLANKIYRLSSGGLMGQAGQNDGRPLLALFDRVKSLAQLPSYEAIAALRVSSICLVVLPKGRLYKIATTLVSPENWTEDFETNNPDGIGIWELTGFGACGSGTDAALGAMSAGASARDAVAIACKYDVNSRPPVHVVKLEQKR
jgi:hypothetical protein